MLFTDLWSLMLVSIQNVEQGWNLQYNLCLCEINSLSPITILLVFILHLPVYSSWCILFIFILNGLKCIETNMKKKKKPSLKMNLNKILLTMCWYIEVQAPTLTCIYPMCQPILLLLCFLSFLQYRDEIPKTVEQLDRTQFQIYLAKFESEILSLIEPLGSRDQPIRSCKDLFKCYPEAEDGKRILLQPFK